MDGFDVEALKRELLNDRETRTIVAAYVGLHRGAPSEELEKGVRAILEWAYRARLNETTLSLALKGAVVLDWDEKGGVKPVATEAGRRMAERGRPVGFAFPASSLN